jgi:hypothetical protein
MLYAFGFETIGVVMSDLYFLDPNQRAGQEGPERGVRLEVRMLDRADLNGSVYSAQPIGVGKPIWRADLLERADGPAGAFDRTHHHPVFTGWEPSKRTYVEALSANPVDWVGAHLSNLDALLDEAGVDKSAIDPADGERLHQAVPEITDTLRRLLERVHAGELGVKPAGDVVSARAGWL